jgi:hypothetical protein
LLIKCLVLATHLHKVRFNDGILFSELDNARLELVFAFTTLRNCLERVLILLKLGLFEKQVILQSFSVLLQFAFLALKVPLYGHIVLIELVLNEQMVFDPSVQLIDLLFLAHNCLVFAGK